MDELQTIIEYISGLRLSALEKTRMETDFHCLIASLPDTVMMFRYRKKDGTERTAYGTRCSEIIDRYCPAGGGSKKAESFGTFAYFDIEKHAWRCFLYENLLEVCSDYDI